MSDRKKKIIELIEEELPELDMGFLSKIYSYIHNSKDNCDSGKHLDTISKEELIEKFIGFHNTISSKNTKCNYKSVLNDLLKCVHPEITDARLLDYIKNKTWKPNTLRRNLIIINRFLRFLYEKAYIITDLSNIIKVPSKVATAELCPSDEQLGKLFSVIKATFSSEKEVMLYECVFKLYAKTGMRRNELLNLNIEDLDFNEKKVIIRNTKNGDDRFVPMDSAIEKLLKNYLSYFKYQNGPLFRGRRGKRLVRQSLAIAFSKIKAKAELPKKLKIHSFRRHFINTLRKNGIDLVTTALLVGHRDIKTTVGYCSIEDTEMASAIEKVRI